MSRAGGQESVRISVIARVRNAGVCFSHFLMRFAGGGLALVRINGVSVITRCPQARESSVVGKH